MTTIETGLETVIITGSSGLIGSAFLAHAGERYTELCLDSKGPPRLAPKTAHIIPCDLTSDENLHQALDEVRRLGHRRIASILHLAAYYSFASESSPLYEQVNVRGTERLLHGLRDFEVEQFIFASTMLVHAPCEPGQKINEDWPLQPKWDYPQSKVTTEQLIRDGKAYVDSLTADEMRRTLEQVGCVLVGQTDDMVPASQVLEPLRRTVREVSARLNKDVNLELVGGDVRLDRRILDALKFVGDDSELQHHHARVRRLCPRDREPAVRGLGRERRRAVAEGAGHHQRPPCAQRDGLGTSAGADEGDRAEHAT